MLFSEAADVVKPDNPNTRKISSIIVIALNERKRTVVMLMNDRD